MERFLGGGRSEERDYWGNLEILVLALLATLTLALNVGHLVEEEVSKLPFTGPPVILSLMLYGVCYWVWSRDYSNSEIERITIWILIGTGLMGLITFFISYYQSQMYGVVMSDVQFMISSNMAVGAIGGSLMGLYWVRATRAEKRIRQQSEELEILNRVVRHDIRNDINLVMGYLNEVKNHVQEGGEELIEQMERPLNHTIYLTLTAKDMVDTITERESAELEEVNLGETVDSVVETTQTNFPRATVEAEDVPEDLEVLANEMLFSLLYNLTSNGVQHNDKENPEVTISVDEAGKDRVEISVVDNGPGISRENRERIFGKGEKGLESSGTGIGLYLVNKLTETYGGDVWIEDNEPEGTIFKVELEKA